jgi:eukaryotic-like serine/threonine-protein kinase
MTRESRCPNPTCGRLSTFGTDPLGRTFRCPRCGSKLNVGRAALGSGAGKGTSPSQPWEEERLSSRPTLGKATPSRVGRFEVRGSLGSGTFATVYRAFDPALEREVALKVPHARAVSGAKALARFFGEAKALAQLRHPRIVPIFEAGSVGEVHFLATAFIPGTTLERRLESGAIAARRAAEIAADLAEALGHAHRLGIAHRDIQPSNVLIDGDEAVYLSDFGLAHRGAAARRLGACPLIGTPAYLAPEQPTAEEIADLSTSDQYSLGVVFYQMLCGRVPFLGPPQLVVYSARYDDPVAPRVLRPDLPRALERICRRAMARRPADRYPSCDALAGDLRDWLENGTKVPLPSRTGSVSRAVGWLRRRRAIAAAAFGLMGLAATGGGDLLYPQA